MPEIKLDPAFWQKALAVVVTIAAAALAAWLLSFINGKVFKALNRKQKGIHLVFFERLCKGVIIVGVFILAFSALDGGSSVWKTMLGGTAVVSAVVAFAAQDVIKDILAGLMISLQKPFEIGDRIELEDGTVGVVEDMTNRHVVLIGLDTLRIIVPNSRVNAMKLTNYCFRRDCRSASFSFPIGYDSDVDLAKQTILDAIAKSPLTVPGKEKDGEPCYAGVYFTAFESSDLLMKTTVYYEKTTPTELVIDDVNTRVRAALNAAGVEIPYNYLNVVDVRNK